MIRTAVFDDKRTYRWRLERMWAPGKGWATWIMLNPSTADAQVDDATIRRCVGFARQWGLGGIVVVNLFAYRATNPRALYQLSEDVATGGERNDRVVVRAARDDWSKVVVAAWGAHGQLFGRDRKIVELLDFSGAPTLQCLGRTKDGVPRHPLRLAADTPLEDLV